MSQFTAISPIVEFFFETVYLFGDGGLGIGRQRGQGGQGGQGRQGRQGRWWSVGRGE